METSPPETTWTPYTALRDIIGVLKLMNDPNGRSSQDVSEEVENLVGKVIEFDALANGKHLFMVNKIPKLRTMDNTMVYSFCPPIL